MNEWAIDFWSRVKDSLKEKKLTQEELAKSASVDFNNLKQQIFHKRMPSADEAVFIAKVLNTSVEYLVTGETTDPYKSRYDSLVEAIRNLPVD